MAIADIEAEAKAFQSELLLVRDEIAGMRVGITNLVKNPMGALAPQLLIPATAALAKIVSASGKVTPTPAKKKPPKTRASAKRRKTAAAASKTAPNPTQTA